MKEADLVKINMSIEEAVIGFHGGVTPKSIKQLVNNKDYLHWETKTNPETNKEKRFVICDYPRNMDGYMTRINRVLLECENEDIYYLTKKWNDKEYTDDYKRAVYYDELPHKIS